MRELINYNNDFVNYLNGRKVKDLNYLFKDMITSLYPFVNENSIIKCWKSNYKQKSDIFIKINSNIYGISIIEEQCDLIHTESIYKFINFLKSNNVSNKIINEFLKYHYQDGTNDGSGKRVSNDEYKKYNQDKIDEVNKIFNEEKMLKKAISHFIIKGNNSNYPISMLIYGKINDFFWITKEDIKRIILAKKDKYETSIHFGPLIFHNDNTSLDKNSKYYKHNIQIKWDNLFEDIMEYKNNMIMQEIIKEL